MVCCLFVCSGDTVGGVVCAVSNGALPHPLAGCGAPFGRAGKTGSTVSPSGAKNESEESTLTHLGLLALGSDKELNECCRSIDSK